MKAEKLNFEGFQLIALATKHELNAKLFSTAAAYENAKRAYENPDDDQPAPYRDKESQLHYMEDVARELVRRLLRMNGSSVYLIGRGFLLSWVNKDSIDEVVALADEFVQKLFAPFDNK